MEKFTYEDIPLDIMEALGFDMEQLRDDKAFMNRFLSGIRSRPVTVNVIDMYEETVGVKGKIRLARDYNGKPTVKIQYAQVDFIDLKQPFWRHSFDKNEIRKLLKHKQLLEPFEIKYSETENVTGVLGIDTELNILQFTPSDLIWIPDIYNNVKIENDEKLLLKTGRMVFKEESNSILYYDNTFDRIRLKTPTPELLLEIRKGAENMQNRQKQEIVKTGNTENRKEMPEALKNLKVQEAVDPVKKIVKKR